MWAILMKKFILVIVAMAVAAAAFPQNINQTTSNKDETNSCIVLVKNGKIAALDYTMIVY